MAKPIFQNIASWLKSLGAASSLFDYNFLCVDSAGAMKKGSRAAVGHIIRDCISLPSNDLNAVLTPGLYTDNGSATNRPPGLGNTSFFLEVIQRSTLVFQRYTTLSGMATRRYQASSASWGDWVVYMPASTLNLAPSSPNEEFIKLDDLKEILTSEQMSLLEDKVAARTGSLEIIEQEQLKNENTQCIDNQSYVMGG